jgi:thiol-disulfide isomerase/thioredoxin
VHRLILLRASISSLVLLASCKKPEIADYAGWYRVTLAKQGGPEIPFFLSLPSTLDGKPSIVNGRQWFSGELVWKDGEVVVELPPYHTRFHAKKNSEGTLVGKWESTSPTWGGSNLELRGTRVPEADPALRFPESAPPFGELAGVWKVKFSESKEARLWLERGQGSAVSATLNFASGNTVFLAGNAGGRRVRLSGFDGTSPYLVTAELSSEPRRLRGEWLAAQDLGWKEKFEAEPAPADFALPSPVHVKSEDKKIKIKELDGPPYAGRPVIVSIIASWCVHCRNAASFYRQIYERYHPLGLEMLSLDYELTEDPAYNAKQAEELKRRYGFTWQVVAKDGTLEDFWAALPEGLAGDEIPELPLTILIDREGVVRDLHAGFVGPESESQHDELKAKLEAAIRAMF